MTKSGNRPHSGPIAVLDVGTAKVCCFIAHAEGDGPPRIVGIGHQVSRGLRAGGVVDMEAAEAAIGQAVHAAEHMAGETVPSVVVNVAAGHPTSHTVAVEVAIAGHAVGDGDVRRALDQGLAVNGHGERELIHSLPVGYAIDGDRGIRDPRGMYGQRLGVHMHLVTAAGGAVRNLRTCIERCHLDVGGLAVNPYAAGVAVLVEDEKNLGVTLIDMGAGTTSLAVFFEGQAIFTDAVAVGGSHVTNDIARGLCTPVTDAERIKTLHGCATASADDERHTIDVPPVGEDGAGAPNPVPRSLLNSIIQPRLEETLELVRARLEASGLDRLAGCRVVLTGGASQLEGVREMAAFILDKQVRAGRPLGVRGLADSVSGPAFATAAGLVALAGGGDMVAAPGVVGKSAPTGLAGRVGQWVREHL